MSPSQIHDTVGPALLAAAGTFTASAWLIEADHILRIIASICATVASISAIVHYHRLRKLKNVSS